MLCCTGRFAFALLWGLWATSCVPVVFLQVWPFHIWGQVHVLDHRGAAFMMRVTASILQRRVQDEIDGGSI